MSNTSSRRAWIKKKEPKIDPNLVSVAVNFTYEAKFGYEAYWIYFPDDDNGKIVKCVIHFEKFFNRNLQNFSLEQIRTQLNVLVDYKLLISDQILCEEWTDLSYEIINNTEFCLNCMGLAIHQTIFKAGLFEDNCRQIVRVRLINYDPIQQIKDIKVNNYGKLISLRGTVVKASNLKLTCLYLAFSCTTCTGIQIVKQIDGCYTVPNKCKTMDCKAKSFFKPEIDSEFKRLIDCQQIRIQELIGTEEFEKGRLPRTIECELTEDLVNSCIPGDDVTVTGIIKVSNERPQKNKNTTYELQLDVVSIINNKNNSGGSYGACEGVSFNTTDYYAIEKIQSEPNLFRLLVQSLSPNIYGHELVKAGLVLGLFGGNNYSKQRAESHILMVGDPGLGKSQLLHACTNVAPRGIYVCGSNSTGSGLTVTMVRESGGEYSIEAGALMLADQGLCCIDEFDKMPTQHASLLEAMEQQSVSIAKAGIVCTLPTRATIFAAANPSGGHYNKGKTIAENLKMSSPMLSRFDLVFILVDKSNEEVDMMLSEHVLAMHSGRNSIINRSISKKMQKNNLKGRLSLQVGEEMENLPHNLFRKYIAYSQKYVRPKILEKERLILKEFYLQLREKYRNGDSTPITLRQLHSLMRLTEARAKLELREEVTKQDVNDVIEIMQETMNDIFTDNAGVLDTTRSQNGTGMSTKKQIMKLLSLMQEKSESDGRSIFKVKEIKELSSDAGIAQNRFNSVLQSLNTQGYILNKGASNYQLVTADL